MENYYMWLVILAASTSKTKSIENRLTGCSPVKLVFRLDMILPKKHMADWEWIRQLNQAQINEYNIQENSKRVDHDHKIRYKAMFTNISDFKY